MDASLQDLKKVGRLRPGKKPVMAKCNLVYFVHFILSNQADCKISEKRAHPLNKQRACEFHSKYDKKQK